MNFKYFCESNDGEHEYSCTMALIKDKQAKIFQKFGRLISNKDLAEHGREMDTHATILYGTHTNNVHEVKAILADSGIKEIHMKLKALSCFPDNGDGVPLKVDVESKELKTLHALLKKKLENSDEWPTYKPHITIAYLKDGTEKKYLDADPFEGKELTTSEIMFATKEGKQICFNLNEL